MALGHQEFDGPRPEAREQEGVEDPALYRGRPNLLHGLPPLPLAGLPCCRCAPQSHTDSLCESP
eukprot:7272011-Heterocapsa_arctica.AAC.1